MLIQLKIGASVAALFLLLGQRCKHDEKILVSTCHLDISHPMSGRVLNVPFSSQAVPDALHETIQISFGVLFGNQCDLSDSNKRC